MIHVLWYSDKGPFKIKWVCPILLNERLQLWLINKPYSLAFIIFKWAKCITYLHLYVCLIIYLFLIFKQFRSSSWIFVSIITTFHTIIWIRCSFQEKLWYCLWTRPRVVARGVVRVLLQIYFVPLFISPRNAINPF